MRRATILLCLSLAAAHCPAEAVVMESASYRADLSVVIAGGGATVAAKSDAKFTAIGENNIYLLLVSSPSHNVAAGQGFLLGVLQAIQPPSPWLISDLRAYTAPLGAPIPEKTWTKDADPYFEWRIDIEPPNLLKEFWVALDADPDGSTKTYTSSYQFPDASIPSGEHTFSVLPVGFTEKPDLLTALKYEIWVDRTPPYLNQVSPTPGSTVNQSATPVSSFASDSDSGLDLAATTFTINGGSAGSTYDAGTRRLTAAGSLSEGRNSVMIKAFDLVGNYVTQGWDFIVDTQPPVGSIAINAGAALTHSAYVSIYIEAKDTTSQVGGVYLSNDGVFDTEMQHPIAYQPVIPNWLLVEPDVDGVKNVYAKFRDSAGNLSQTYAASITLRRLTPDTRIISGPETLTEKKDADFTFEASKPGCLFSYALDTQGWTDWQLTATIHLSGLSLGNHHFYVKSGFDLNGDNKITIDEEDATPAQWVWTIQTPAEIEKMKQKILFWRR